MPDRVPVRLVPKTAEGASLLTDVAEITPRIAKQFSPDRRRAESAQGLAFSKGIECRLSPRNSLDGLIPIDKFKDVFGSEVETRQFEPEYPSASARHFFAPKRELTVPAELQETIAFAYVPIPPEFAAETFVPPPASVYHLRLGDVTRALKARPCHRRGWSGRGIRVAMADTGFYRHPFYEGQGYNIQRVSTTGTDASIDEDPDGGHGTGESANVLVTAPDCHFFGVKHNDYSALALEGCLAQNPHVMTNSWGWNVDNRSFDQWKVDDPNVFNELRDIERILADAIDEGVTVFFCVGNGHRFFPSSMPDVIAVGGTTVDTDGSLKASSFASSFESQLYPGRRVPDICGITGELGTSPMKGHIMLPVPNGTHFEGTNLPASQSNKGWGIFSGTSAATPQVAAIAALMLSVNPALTRTEIKRILAATATDVEQGRSILGDTAAIGFDNATGAGFANAIAACLMVEQLQKTEC